MEESIHLKLKNDEIFVYERKRHTIRFVYENANCECRTAIWLSFRFHPCNPFFCEFTDLGALYVGRVLRKVIQRADQCCQL